MLAYTPRPIVRTADSAIDRFAPWRRRRTPFCFPGGDAGSGTQLADSNGAPLAAGGVGARCIARAAGTGASAGLIDVDKPGSAALRLRGENSVMKLFSRWSRDAAGDTRGLYVSPFEQFLNRYKASHPDVARQQMEGRALLWDKRPMSSETTDEPYGAGRIDQPGYVYYSNPD
jgi:hypothetical protein